MLSAPAYFVSARPARWGRLFPFPDGGSALLFGFESAGPKSWFWARFSLFVQAKPDPERMSSLRPALSNYTNRHLRVLVRPPPVLEVHSPAAVVVAP